MASKKFNSISIEQESQVITAVFVHSLHYTLTVVLRIMASLPFFNKAQKKTVGWIRATVNHIGMALLETAIANGFIVLPRISSQKSTFMISHPQWPSTSHTQILVDPFTLAAPSAACSCRTEIQLGKKQTNKQKQNNTPRQIFTLV